MTNDELTAIEQRAAAATPGPWEHERNSIHMADRSIGGPMIGWFMEYDLEFMAHARTDIPALVAEVRRLREENAALHKAVLDYISAVQTGQGKARIDYCWRVMYGYVLREGNNGK